MKKLLLLSNSTLPGKPFLSFARSEIQNFLKTPNCRLVFIPYAAVTSSYDDYTANVRRALDQIKPSITGIHEVENPARTIKESQGIVV